MVDTSGYEADANASTSAHPPRDERSKIDSSDHERESNGREQFSEAQAQPTTADQSPVNNRSSIPEGSESNSQPESASQDASEVADLQDLTLAELFGLMRQAPGDTWSALLRILRPDAPERDVIMPTSLRTRLTGTTTAELAESAGARQGFELDVSVARSKAASAQKRLRRVATNTAVWRIVLYTVAFVLALIGARTMGIDSGSTGRLLTDEFANGVPFLLYGFAVAAIAEIVGGAESIHQWGRRRRRPAEWVLGGLRVIVLAMLLGSGWLLWQSTAPEVSAENALNLVFPGMVLGLLGVVFWVLLDVVRWLVLKDVAESTSDGKLRKRIDHDASDLSLRKIPLWRLPLIAGASAASVFVWLGSANNTFSDATFYLWILSIALWSLVFAPPLRLPTRLSNLIDARRRFRLGHYMVVIVTLGAILTLGAYFRLNQLDAHPREMTDDHVELILDAGRVRDGQRTIFFANNGGREPTQMYLIGLASYLPGLGINFYTIKVVAAIESVLTILAVFWMGYAVTEGETRRRRLLTALFTAGFLAASYWHVAISRQALRIPLTPLIAALLIVFVVRGLRHNRRADFIWAGILLGAGLYMYQAVRLLPIFIVVAVVVAAYFRSRSWADVWRYSINLAVLASISALIFLPMFRYSLDFPEEFWRRAAGRLLGDSVITETLSDGTVVQREASVAERAAAFRDNVPQLMNNFRNAFLMFHWRGDVATISGKPHEAALDPISGALLILGLATLIAQGVRRRDVVYWLIPVYIFIALLPSAVSIAYPNENPSHTRTSAAIPMVYLLLALPLAFYADWLIQQTSRARGYVIVAGLGTVLIFGSYMRNAHIYMDEYPPMYEAAFDPYTEPGKVLRGFAISDGGYGNAFMIGYPHWWSHRAIGLAGGLETQWPNGIVSREQIPSFLNIAAGKTDMFRLDVERDLMFFYSPLDEETGAYLADVFPNGRAAEYPTYAPNNNFMIYRVPALGAEGFAEFVAEHMQS